MAGITVLCADPDVGARETTTARLSDDLGMATVPAATVEKAQAAVADNDIDCVVTEYDFPERTGLDLVDFIREQAPDTPCVLFTDRKPDELDTASFEGLIVEYLHKNAPEAHARLGDLVQDMWVHRSQVGYLLPDDESERLEALDRYDVEDMDIEDTAERISTLVASHFDVPVAFVGLVERTEESFVACHGANWDTLDREDTICTHAILEEDVMVVEDITADHRFKNNDTLNSLGIRSYAGASMTTPDGHTIGALCLIDYEPQSYTDEQTEELMMFADEAVEQLELRRRLLERDGAEVEP
jgi:CheY-like chemotaxis protein